MFPLLRLPFVAIREVVTNFNTEETFDFSECSRKTRKLVLIWSRNRFYLDVHYIYINKIILYSRNDRADTLTFVFEHFMVHTGLLILEKYAEDPKTRFYPFQILSGTFTFERQFIDNILNTFGCLIRKVTLGYSLNLSNFRTILDSLLFYQTTYQCFSIAGPIEHDDIIYFINNFNVTECLDLSILPTRPFDHRFKLDLYSIYCVRSRWASVSEIQRMSFTAGHFESFLMNADSWIEIINLWINGWNKRMKCLSFDSEVFDLNRMVNNVKGKLTDQQIVRRFETPVTEYCSDGENLLIPEGYDINRIEDGATATVSRHPWYPKRFLVLVWD